MKLIIILFGILFINQSAIAQKKISIRGVVNTNEGKPLSGASVLFFYKGETDTLKTAANEKGVFSFKNILPKKVGIIVSYVGYKSYINYYDYTNAFGEQIIMDIVMQPGSGLLEDVVVESSKIQIKEDTISYKIDSTMYRKNDKVEDLLKKLPGMQVDKDGNVTAQGKQVTKVKVNGKEFFNGDVTTATKQINADMVDKIQVVDDYGDQSAFTGIKDGDPSKTLNIELRKDKNKGYFGNLSAGGGTNGRYANNLSLNKFNNNQQISLLGNLNNTNASLFNFGSLGGGMGRMIGGMVRGMGIGGNGGGVAAIIGNLGGGTDGIATTKSIGLNYRDEWSPKLSVNGSYSFSEKASNTIQNITQQNIFQNNKSTNIQNTDDYSVTDNHRFSFNMEYKIDSFNYLKFTPNISYNKSYGDDLSEFVFLGNNDVKASSGNSADNKSATSPNLNGNILFNHRFLKRGRTISLNFSGGNSANNRTDDYQNLSTYFFPGSSFDTSLYQKIIQDNNNHNYGFRASYTEPLSKKRNLELNYSYNHQFTGNDKETFAVNPTNGNKTYVDSLSNIYDNDYITNRFGINLRTTEKKYNYTIGMGVQPATIQSNSITGKSSYTQNLVNYYPVLRVAYNFSRSRSFNLNYNGNTNQPAYNQLQPVSDYTNPQYITVGNPTLKPEFTNTFSSRYNNFDFISGNVFFGNITVSFTKDKIVNNTFRKPFGVQEIRYVNTNGFYNVLGFYNVSKPIQNRKYVFNVGGNVLYNNNVSYINDEKNVGKNWVFSQRISTDITIKKWMETTVAANYSLNSTKFSLQTEANSTTNSWTFNHSARFFIKGNWIINYDLDKTINSGYASNVITNPLIINGGLEKQLFKNQVGSLKLQAFDLLDENTNINRTVNGNAIIDTRTNKIGSYFMMSFTYRLNKFNSKQMEGKGMRQEMRIMGMPGGM